MQMKPQRKAFMARYALVPVMLFAVLGLAGVVAAVAFSMPVLFLGLPVCVALIALVGYRAAVMYRKERYELSGDRIVVLRGGLVSDAEIELQLDHVTHVKWIRPWLWHKFFGTGTLQIEAAGSAASEVIFRDMDHSDQVYLHIREVLHDYGFAMSTGTLLHREGPADIGIVAELIAGGIGAVFGAGLFIGPAIVPAVVAFPPILLLAPVVLAGLAAGLAIRYLDLKRRTYSVYDGVIEYHEGFLTRNDAFIPVENLSNSETSRGLLDRITDLYQVKVSCQGAGQEIVFRHLENGEQLNGVLEDLINAQSEPAASQTPSAQSQPRGEREQPAAATRDTETTAEFTMNARRTLVPVGLCYLLLPVLVVLFPLFFGLIAYTIYELVRVRSTTYNLNRNAVKEKFEFITAKTREFTTDKITGVTFRRSIIDQWFGTCSVKFWSIGSAEEITFRNIAESEELENMVLGKAGIFPRETLYTIQSDFCLRHAVMANLPGIAVLVLGTAAGPVLAALVHPALVALSAVFIGFAAVGYVYGRYYYPRSKVSLFDNCVAFSRGLLVRQQTLALYPNVKDISTTKYPFVDNGCMRFNVAGEQLRKTQNGETRIPYGFTIHYVPQILDKDEVFDQLLLGREARSVKAAEPVLIAGKAAGNTLFVIFVVSVILFPLIALLPLTVPLALWRIRLVRYIVEPDRVLMRKGVLYRKQTSIIFDRIDHIQTSQNALNKLFNNGNLIINTAGSSRPELVLSNIPDWQQFHQQLQRHY